MTAVLFWSFVAFVAVFWILRKRIRGRRRNDERFIDRTLFVAMFVAALVLLYMLALSP